MIDVSYNPWLHRFAKLLTASTFLLIFIGGLVTSTGSGLSVPDWPTTYGHFMFAFPFSKMVGGILYEHGHRMVASVVGLLTVVLAVWLWVSESRRWVKWFGLGALTAVIAQGVLGGLTVLFQLPTPISVLHGCLAQGFFMMTIAIAVFTSRRWCHRNELQRGEDMGQPKLQTLALVTTFVIYLQLVIGAIMRHSGAGLAIPDFPLAFGKIFPPIESQAVAIHFLHRVGALIVSVAILWTSIQIYLHHRKQKKLVNLATTLLVALAVQISLAALTIWTRKAVLPTTLHVATGAFILGSSLVLTLRTHLLLRVTPADARASYVAGKPSTHLT